MMNAHALAPWSVRPCDGGLVRNDTAAIEHSEKGMNVTLKLTKLALLTGALVSANAMATSAEQRAAAHNTESTMVQMHTVDANGTVDNIGTVAISKTDHGLVFTPDLRNLAPGVHGFHVHEKPSCDATEADGKKVPAGAAGGHYDPDKTGRHGTPWGDGHLGDLPPLFVDAEGKATHPVLAPRLKELSQVSNRALMVHQGGDNHADHPSPLGGGGARVACGIIQ